MCASPGVAGFAGADQVVRGVLPTQQVWDEMIGLGCFSTTPMTFRVFSQYLAPCGGILFIVRGVLAWHLTRLRLVLARPLGGLLAGHGLGLWSGSCLWLSVVVVCVLMVTQCKGMIAHPLGCPPQFPFFSLMTVYITPERFACFISCCMIQGALIYPCCQVSSNRPAMGLGLWF